MPAMETNNTENYLSIHWEEQSSVWFIEQLFEVIMLGLYDSVAYNSGTEN